MAILGCACRRGGGGGGGKITTTHEHYTDFEIDGVAFRCYGDLTFKDGDKVRLYGVKTNKGYYYVVLLQNFTRGFYVGERPANPNLDSNIWKKKKANPIVSIFIIALLSALGGAIVGLVIGFIVAIIWGAYGPQTDTYATHFYAAFKVAWLITTIAFPVIAILIYIIPKSESTKQKEKQQEEDELNRRKEAWAMYQKVINDDE